MNEMGWVAVGPINDQYGVFEVENACNDVELFFVRPGHETKEIIEAAESGHEHSFQAEKADGTKQYYLGHFVGPSSNLSGIDIIGQRCYKAVLRKVEPPCADT